ncbi:MAG: hypothetical protein LH478_01125 [Chitinophagaceae bacterium]|nr:hypothetical protein [Chitinophagaceae bacterium]
MQKTTFEIPQTTVAAAREFMELRELKEKSQPSINTTLYTRSAKQSGQYFPKSFSTSTSGWESFSNELEFE